MSKKHYAIYGNTVLNRGYCPKCKGMSLIVDGILQCCDTEFKGEDTHQMKVMSEASHKRKRPPLNEQKEILARQDSKCLYCDIIFGTPLWRTKTKKIVFTKCCFDHFVPFSYSYNNKKVNFVAACHICNGIKSNKMFNTIQDVSDYVKYHRTKKGYKTLEEIQPDVQDKDVVNIAISSIPI